MQKKPKKTQQNQKEVLTRMSLSSTGKRKYNNVE